MPQIQCEACGSTAPGGRSAFPDVGLVCDKCFDEGYGKLTTEQQRLNPPRGLPTQQYDSRGKPVAPQAGR